MGPGTARDRLPVLDQMLDMAEAAGDKMLAWEARFGRFVALLELADPVAYIVFDRAAADADALGQPHFEWIILSRRVVLAVLSGRFEEADRLTPHLAATAERLGEPGPVSSSPTPSSPGANPKTAARRPGCCGPRPTPPTGWA